MHTDYGLQKCSKVTPQAPARSQWPHSLLPSTFVDRLSWILWCHRAWPFSCLQGHQSTSISKFSQPQSWDRDAKILIYLVKSSIPVQYISDTKWKTKATVQAGKVTGYKYRAPLLGYHKNLWTSVPKRFSHLTTRSSLSYQVVLAGLCPKKGSERFYNPVTKSV